jgi:hypothetical protein
MDYRRFFSKLKLKNEGIDLQKKILIMFHYIVIMFGQNNRNGWKVCMTKDVIPLDYSTLLKLYEKVYAHPPTNGDYLGILL